MRITLFLFLLFLSKTINAQNRIKFNYDSAGNQEQRYLCINCSTARTANDTVVKGEDLISEEEIKKENLISQVKYFPNPVLEELKVSWTNETQNKLQNIEIYTLNGQLIKTYPLNLTQESIKIPFGNYSDGYYNLVLNYSNGTRKTLKIVKVKN